MTLVRQVLTADHRLILAVLLITVAATRFVTFAVFIPLDTPSSKDYWFSIPTSLAMGDGYKGCNPNYFLTCDQPAPTAAREPVPVFLYAALIRLFGWHREIIFLAQVLLDVGTGFLIYRIASAVFARRGISQASLLLWAFYIPSIDATGQLHWAPTAALMLAIFVSTLTWMLQKPCPLIAILSGVALGLVCLTRSSYLYSIVVWIPALWFALGGSSRDKARHLALFGLAMALTLSPWVIRNYLVFGAFVPGTTLNGYNLFRHTYILEDQQQLWYAAQDETRDALLERLNNRLRGDENEIELDTLYTQEALKNVEAQPKRYVLLTVSRLWDIWFNLRPGQLYSEILSTVFVLVVHLGLWAFSMPALVIAPSGWFRRGWPLLLLLVYSTLIYLPVTARVIYVAPVAPYLFMLAGYGCWVVRESRRNHLVRAA